MKLRTVLFIAAGLVSGPVPILSPLSVAVGSPMPQGYFAVPFAPDKADLGPGKHNLIDWVSHALADHGDQFDVTDDAKNMGISADDRAVSDHRAKAVVARLVADGIPKSTIKICYTVNFGSAYSAIYGACGPQHRQFVVFMPYTPVPLPPGVREVP